ncbi:MAG TPA: glycosyltransferase family 2 protein [Burkholderiaceae bacterium]|nr:glycosyltransferase family 2 protein [Burkholderiaceae bacterium]
MQPSPSHQSNLKSAAPLSVSIAMCTYNGARYLPQQLDSLLAQTRRPNEIIIVDDCSTDATPTLLNEFCARANALGIAARVERNAQNLGVTRNFERALRLTTGDVLFTCDQDDVWHAEKIDRMTREFESRAELLLLHTDARLVDADGADLGCGLFEALEMSDWEFEQVRSGNAFNALIRRNLVTGAAAALRRSLVHDAGTFPSVWVHDEWLAAVAAAIGRVDVMRDALIDYRQHGGNQIGMRKLSFKDKLDRLRRSRGDFHAKMVRRIEALLAHLRALGGRCAADKVRLVEGKLEHARLRATLPANRFARIPRVAAEALHGGYHQYSTGVRAIVRDLFEPI